MESITFIHIGDVHFQDVNKKYINEHADKAVSETLVNDISPLPFAKVSEYLSLVLEQNDIDAVLISGDLASRGCTDSYQSCVEHFLGLNNFFLSNPEKIHIVPGNHDLIRPKESEQDKFAKFLPFSEIWRSRGLDVLQPDIVRSSITKRGDGGVRFLSLNTCYGCGEFRFESQSSGQNIEQLDSPSVCDLHISILQSLIQNDRIEDCSLLPIILGHHGILPQSVSRIKPYTEMMNGGYLRTVLSSFGYPIIYCHGHIHEDPVEIIVSPKTPNSEIISISAPSFSDGFNLVSVYFSSKNVPIGLKIKPFRTDYSGIVKEQASIECKIKTSEYLDDTCSKDAENIYAKLSRSDYRYKELKKEFEDVDNSTLDNSLRELHWLGYLQIDNFNRAPEKWLIKKVGI